MSDDKHSFSAEFQHDELSQPADISSQNQDFKKDNLAATTTSESAKASTSLFLDPSSDSVTTRTSPSNKNNSSPSDVQLNTTPESSITHGPESDVSKHATTTHDLDANKPATDISTTHIPDLDTQNISTTISADDHVNSLPTTELSTTKIPDSDTNKQANTMTSHGSPKSAITVDPTSNEDSNSVNHTNQQTTHQSTDTAYTGQPANKDSNGNILPTDESSTSEVLKSDDNKQVNMIPTNDSPSPTSSTTIVPTSNQDSNVVDQTNPPTVDSEAAQDTNQSNGTAETELQSNNDDHGNPLPTNESSTSQILDPDANKQAKMVATMLPTSVQHTNSVDQTNLSKATAESPSHKAKLILRSSIEHELNNIMNICPRLAQHGNMIDKDVREVKSQFDKLKIENCDLKDLQGIKKTVTKLKLQIPIMYRTYDESNKPKYQKSNVENKTASIPEKLRKKMPRLHHKLFNESLICKSIHLRFNNLRCELKLCLLCFSVFPENAIISRRLMIYLWIGEGLIPGDDYEAEDCANGLFKELIELDFIVPVSSSYGRHVAVCKMNPLVRAALVMIADNVKFFDFDGYGNPKDFGKLDESRESLDESRESLNQLDEQEKINKRTSPNSYRVCLMGSGLSQGIPWENLHTLFNVQAKNLEFRPEWFLRMKNVNVMFLGRWQRSISRRIEVEEFEFEKCLDNMNHVRFFSLQGVSRISRLPDSISKLKSLVILDLRSCHNLEVIPGTIGSLKCLTHLDMSECYLLNTMPKEISFLKSLQVLKGFVVVESPRPDICTLEDLAKLENLRKLHMYTHMNHFPQDSHLDALEKFEILSKLTILWRGNESSSHTKKYEIKKKNSLGSKVKICLPRKKWVKGSMKRMDAFGSSTLGLRLEKLDLRCFPHVHTPKWLTAGKLEGLKKLYIRGGNISSLGQHDDIHDWNDSPKLPKETWNVKILRLRYLEELDMEWRELQNLFPKLVSLEKVKCPRLTHFPCNEQGVWMKIKG